MKIDRRLNLVVPIYGDPLPKTDEKGTAVKDGAGKPVMVTPVVAHVHSAPISAEVAERYFVPLAQTFSGIFNLGLGVAAGPGVAAKLLRKLSVDGGVWEDDPRTGAVGVKNGLLEEIWRQTSVIAKIDNGGWTPVPLPTASARGLISAEDRAEVENAIVFFTAVSATLGRAQRTEMLEAACALWDARLSSLNSSEEAHSLPRSIAIASSGASAPATAPVPQPAANAARDGRPSSVAA